MSDNNRKKLSDLNLPNDLKTLSISECTALCKEIRQLLISTVSKNGGHLASNLGAVELTVALHKNFNSPEDKIVWDVGHQAYTHKILTGRADSFSTLRQENGLSGFPKPEESEHDTFISGHSSTSVSVAYAISEGFRLQNKDNYAIAVIGDGAVTGGMFYEAMNNCGKERDRNFIVVLNDNAMSISKSVGSVAKYLKSLRNTEKYYNTKVAVKNQLKKLPFGNSVEKKIRNVKDSVKANILEESTMFEDMGFVYLGPVDGHNLAELDEVIHIAKHYHRPVFIHVKTTKGKGYGPAEKNPGEFHGISRFDIATGNPEVSGEDSYSTVFGRELTALAHNDEKICAITAAMKYGTGLQHFAGDFPDRFYDVGIAEQHAVTFAGGLASMGFLPVFAVYSTFLQRAYDQLIHDVAIGGLHVVIGVDRAGIVGNDGETHQGLFDISMLTSIPNTSVYSPSSYNELKYCMKKALYEEKGLCAVRYPRGNEDKTAAHTPVGTDYLLQGNSGETLIIAYGRLYCEALKAQKKLKEKGISCDILKLTKIYPVDRNIVEKIKNYSFIVFFEETMSSGSISSEFGEMLAESDYTGVYRHVTVNEFVKQASVDASLEKLGLSSSKMAELIYRRYSENGKA
ncbi:MAG: 1-deoxy-D-xylulose-5-phosphate synthase [Ruminococcus sp.]|nr:1-deoxy-D-xylulose-5-phosphate synthase [Ruminococcus sp.]